MVVCITKCYQTQNYIFIFTGNPLQLGLTLTMNNASAFAFFKS